MWERAPSLSVGGGRQGMLVRVSWNGALKRWDLVRLLEQIEGEDYFKLSG